MQHFGLAFFNSEPISMLTLGLNFKQLPSGGARGALMRPCLARLGAQPGGVKGFNIG